MKEYRLVRKTIAKKKKPVFFVSDLFMLITAVALLSFLIVYGYQLKAADYKIPGVEQDMSVTSAVSYALSSIREGTYPWNYREIMGERYARFEAIYGAPKNHSEETDIHDHILLDDIGVAGTAGNDEGSEDVSTGEGEAGTETADVSEEKELVFMQVEDDYFEDALFLGDSRVVGLCLYSGMENCTFYAKTSLTIFKLMESAPETADVESVRQGLMDNQFNKIYIQVGINEIGTGDVYYFINQYQAVIDEIRVLQPDAIIYINSILHVTAAKCREPGCINNENINARNEALAALADNEYIFYLDVNPILDDKDGNLNSELSWDEVHLTANSYPLWYQFLKDHAVNLDEMGIETNWDQSSDDNDGEEDSLPDDSEDPEEQ